VLDYNTGFSALAGLLSPKKIVGQVSQECVFTRCILPSVAIFSTVPLAVLVFALFSGVQHDISGK